VPPFYKSRTSEAKEDFSFPFNRFFSYYPLIDDV